MLLDSRKLLPKTTSGIYSFEKDELHWTHENAAYIGLQYAEAHADSAGVAATLISGLSLIRSARPSEIQYAFSKPLVALVLQGNKNVRMGGEVFSFGVGDSLIISADVPTASRITEASVGQPYCSLVMELDQAILTELAVDMKAHTDAYSSPIRIEPTDDEVADAALRIMKLLERPTSLPILRQQMVREFHYWLLAGKHGPAIRRLGWPNGQAQKIGRAVAVLRHDFARPLRVETLAKRLG